VAPTPLSKMTLIDEMIYLATGAIELFVGTFWVQVEVLGALTGWHTLSMQNSPSPHVTPLQSTFRNPSGNMGANRLRMYGISTRNTTTIIARIPTVDGTILVIFPSFERIL